MIGHARRCLLTTFAAALLLVSPASAHPGHGLGGASASWLHYLSEPLHVAPFAIGALALGVWLRRSRRAHTR